MGKAIRTAVILAAGRGSRLNMGIVKPLIEVAGQPLIGRVIAALQEAGVEKLVLVLGYQSENIATLVERSHGSVMDIRFVVNPLWQKSNGVSLLAARKEIHEPFLLLMADHLLDPEIIKAVRYANLSPWGGLLAVDRLIDQVFDLPDATKVFLADERIESIGKQLSVYNAIDTGVFALKPVIFEALHSIFEQKGDCSLSEGVAALCEKNLMGWVDVSGKRWLDVDTPEAHREAEFLWSPAIKAP